jgi:TusA-related sulfurtransferase
MADSNQSPTTIDLRGVRCPISTIRLKKQLKVLSSGQVVNVLSNDDDARVDFPAVIGKSAATFTFTEHPGYFSFLVTKQ